MGAPLSFLGFAGFSCASCCFCYVRSFQQSGVVDSVWVGWHQSFFTPFRCTFLIFFALFYIEQMKPVNNLAGSPIVDVTIWRAYKFQAFSLQLLNCCSLVRLMTLFYCQFEGQIKFISLQIVSHSCTGKKGPINVPRNVWLRSSVSSTSHFVSRWDGFEFRVLG